MNGRGFCISSACAWNLAVDGKINTPFAFTSPMHAGWDCRTSSAENDRLFYIISSVASHCAAWYVG